MDFARALDIAGNSLSSRQLAILNAGCSAPSCEMSASAVAEQLGLPHHGAVNLEVVRMARKLANAVGAQPTLREDGSTRWWYVLFTGRFDLVDHLFYWKLRSDLHRALRAADTYSLRTSSPSTTADDYE